MTILAAIFVTPPATFVTFETGAQIVMGVIIPVVLVAILSMVVVVVVVVETRVLPRIRPEEVVGVIMVEHCPVMINLPRDDSVVECLPLEGEARSVVIQYPRVVQLLRLVVVVVTTVTTVHRSTSVIVGVTPVTDENHSPQHDPLLSLGVDAGTIRFLLHHTEVWVEIEEMISHVTSTVINGRRPGMWTNVMGVAREMPLAGPTLTHRCGTIGATQMVAPMVPGIEMCIKVQPRLPCTLHPLLRLAPSLLLPPLHLVVMAPRIVILIMEAAIDPPLHPLAIILANL